ncbi:cell wall hydrolase [Peribacillus sp. SCS-155]|uniref:cell wall hydrolase n=1 Tax=Peribacillus sedimenti TaxID=3115297 RepID=UPI003905FCBB
MKRLLFSLFFSLLYILTTGIPATEASVLIREQDSGHHVKKVQEQLGQMGYLHTTPTGKYGTVTQNAVEQFQRDTNLIADGIIGPNTYRQLQNVEKMARVVNGEARGELYEGQVAVAAVILNRIETPGFPKTVSGVITQTNAFTCLSDGQYNLKPNYTAYRAVIDAFKGWDPSSGAVYYYNPLHATSDWIFTRSTIKRIGNHLFAS